MNRGNEDDMTDIIQGAIFAALGCTKIDYSSPKRMDEAAEQIARFVDEALRQNGYRVVKQ